MIEWIKSKLNRKLMSVASTMTEIERLESALNHIVKITNQASQQTVRLKWIRCRARSALYGGDWRTCKRPKNKYMPSVLKRKANHN